MKDRVTGVIKEKGRVQVTVNEETFLWFSRAAFEEHPLKAGEEVALEELCEWLLLRQYPEALNRAVTFLASRARSRQEVEEKLKSRGYMERTRELVLYKLEKERFLNDEEFAGSWIKARLQRQLGKQRIFLELRQKGISREVAEQVWMSLENEEEISEEPAVKLAVKLLNRVQKEPDPRKAMQKVMAAMGRRGFSYGEAKEAVQAALLEISSAEEEDPEM